MGKFVQNKEIFFFCHEAEMNSRCRSLVAFLSFNPSNARKLLVAYVDLSFCVCPNLKEAASPHFPKISEALTQTSTYNYSCKEFYK